MDALVAEQYFFVLIWQRSYQAAESPALRGSSAAMDVLRAVASGSDAASSHRVQAIEILALAGDSESIPKRP